MSDILYKNAVIYFWSGFDSYLSKPVSSAKLFWKLSQFLTSDFSEEHSLREELNVSELNDQSLKPILLTVDTLSDLSEEWKASMKLAIQHVDLEQINFLINQVREQDIQGGGPLLAETMQRKINQFEYQDILDLLQ